MSRESKAERLSRLADEIGYALGRGEFPENTIREFRFLWKTTPDQEKDGLSYTLQDIEKMIKDMRCEIAIQAGAGKLKCIPVDHISGTDQELNNA
ncbi:hypothetical protein EH220_02990 [bacterium]|nr:MAG: hypothetical protein EH220_02990 [bacterium]